MFKHHFPLKVNPIAQILGVSFLLVPIFLSFDPWRPLYVLATGGAVFVLWLKPPFRLFLRFLFPFLYLSISLFIMNLLFTPTPPNAQIYWESSMIVISNYALNRACSVAFRTFSLSMLSIILISSMTPSSLVRALMQQLKLSPRWGYALYAGLNLMPALIQELKTLHQCRMIRYAGRAPEIKEYLTIPILILASAIRKAHRISFSMAARELEGIKVRTFVIKSTWGVSNYLFLVCCGLMSVFHLI